MQKKILFLANDVNLQLGGQGLSNIIILDHLNKKYNVDVFSQEYFETTSNYKNVKATYITNFKESFISGFRDTIRIINDINLPDYDFMIISSTPFSTLLYLLVLTITRKVKSIPIIHFCRIDPLRSIFTASRFPYILYPLGLLLYRKIDKIVIQNPQMGDTFKKYYGVTGTKLKLIPNPLRPTFKKLLNQNKKITIKATRPWIITITRLETKQKDPETLLRAFVLVKEKFKYASLLICGEGSEKEKLQKLASELGIANDVYFLGFVKNPLIYLKRSDIFVLSSKAEGFGKVIVEAQIAKTPVVATDCPVGPRWALDNGRAGILVPVGDEKRMAKGINKLLVDEKTRQKYIARGLRLAKRHYPENFYSLLDNLLLSFK